MKKRLLPLAMLAGLAGICARLVVESVSVIARVLLGIADHEPVKFEAELEHAKTQTATKTSDALTTSPFGTAQAREFVTMLRGIGSGSGERALAA